MEDASSVQQAADIAKDAAATHSDNATAQADDTQAPAVQMPILRIQQQNEQQQQDSTEDSSAKPMSKSAMKKAAKRARLQEYKEQRKAAEKAQKKAASAARKEERAAHAARLTEEERAARRAESQAKTQARKEEHRKKQERLQAALQEGNQRIAIDLDFDGMMPDNDLSSLIQQLSYSYSHNGKAASPCHLHMLGLTGHMKQQAEKQLSGFENWHITRSEQKWQDFLADKLDQVVYLTADSDNELEDLDASKIYIIGGLVDHNRYKGLCHKRATEAGVATAKLPISKYVKLAASHVLTVNHVVQILVEYVSKRDWAAVLDEVLPQRKRAGAQNRKRKASETASEVADEDGKDGDDDNGNDGSQGNEDSSVTLHA